MVRVERPSDASAEYDSTERVHALRVRSNLAQFRASAVVRRASMRGTGPDGMRSGTSDVMESAPRAR